MHENSFLSFKVYECKLDKSLVVKIEEPIEGRFQNVAEWLFWDSVQYNKKISKWLAPCEWISDNGCILLQKKVIPIREHELPEKLPSFLTDIKIENFGILKKKPVCFDDGFINSLCSTQLKKAHWK